MIQAEAELGDETEQDVTASDSSTRPDRRHRATRRGRRVIVVTIVVAAILMTAYSMLPTVFGETLFQAVAWGSVVVIVVGARRHGARSIAWAMMAAGFALFAAGDLMFVIYEDVLHETPFPSYADVLYLAGYPILASGLALLARRSRATRGHAAIIDAGILVVPLTVISWIYLVDPVATARGR